MQRIVAPNIEKGHPLYERIKSASDFIGFELNDGKLMAHLPHLIDPFEKMTMAILAKGTVEGGLKRMMGMIASNISGCRYCLAHTAFTAKKNGIEQKKIEALWRFEKSDLFSAKEKAALQFTLAASIQPSELSNEHFDELKKYFNQEEIVELVAVLSLYAFLNKFNSSLQTDIEEVPATFLQQLNFKHE